MIILCKAFNYNIQRMQKHLKICLHCRQIPENLFYLSCDHQICIPCAQKLATKKSKDYSIDCPICEDQTCFDTKLYSKLQLQKSRLIMQQNHNLQYSQESNSRGINLIQRVDQPFQRYCNDHIQYPILYVCKTCKKSMVCPQCVINGLHKNHEVIPIQKEGELIKQKMNRQLKILNKRVQQLKIIESKRLNKLKTRINQLQLLKNSAKDQYAQIRESLDRQEKAVLSKCNQLLLIHSKEQDSFRVEISKQIHNYEQMRASILNILNPLIKQSIVENCKGLQKISLINFISQYNRLDIQEQITRQIKKSFENEAELDNNIHSLVTRMENLKLSGFRTDLKQYTDSFRNHNLNKFNSSLQNMPGFELSRKQTKHNQNKQPTKNQYFNLY